MTAVVGAVALLVEALLAVEYAARPDVTVTDWLILLYPFVWIDVGVLAVLTTHTPRTTRRRRYVGLVVAGGYLAVLAYFGGLLGAGSSMVPFHVD